jgi:antitoxin component YwqK of YwqJK toxin-antitoxin module
MSKVNLIQKIILSLLLVFNCMVIFSQEIIRYEIPRENDFSRIHGNAIKVEVYAYDAIMNEDGELNVEKTIEGEITDWAEYDYDCNGRLLREAYYEGRILNGYTHWTYDAVGPCCCFERSQFGRAIYSVECAPNQVNVFYDSNLSSSYTYEDDGKISKIIKPSSTTILKYLPDGYTATTYSYFESALSRIIIEEYNANGQLQEKVVNRGSEKYITKVLSYEYDEVGNWISMLICSEGPKGVTYRYEQRIITYL